MQGRRVLGVKKMNYRKVLDCLERFDILTRVFSMKDLLNIKKWMYDYIKKMNISWSRIELLLTIYEKHTIFKRLTKKWIYFLDISMLEPDQEVAIISFSKTIGLLKSDISQLVDCWLSSVVTDRPVVRGSPWNNFVYFQSFLRSN